MKKEMIEGGLFADRASYIEEDFGKFCMSIINRVKSLLFELLEDGDHIDLRENEVSIARVFSYRLERDVEVLEVYRNGRNIIIIGENGEEFPLSAMLAHQQIELLAAIDEYIQL